MSGLRTEALNIFGINSSSRIGLFIHSYLTVVPSLANNLVMMAETTELFDSLLKLELLDHFERMTTKRRMSSVSMQQWLIGAAFHLHVRIHQVRLKECTASLQCCLPLNFCSQQGLHKSKWTLNVWFQVKVCLKLRVLFYFHGMIFIHQYMFLICFGAFVELF